MRGSTAGLEGTMFTPSPPFEDFDAAHGKGVGRLLSGPNLVVKLSPMEIRTFEIRVERPPRQRMVLSRRRWTRLLRL